MNELYNQLNRVNPMPNDFINRFNQFRQTFNGNPQQIVQNMINSGRISQTQVNQLAQQANQIYQQINGKLPSS